MCLIENCNSKVLAKGFCSKHYYQQPKKKAQKKTYNALPARKEYTRIQSKTVTFKKTQQKYQNTSKFTIVIDRYQMSLKGKFKEGIRQAKRREVSWDLTFDQYLDILKSNKCHYCPNPPSPKGSSLDRKDNNKGYAADNCVSCCKDCNRTKGDRLTYEEMVEVGNLLIQMRSKL